MYLHKVQDIYENEDKEQLKFGNEIKTSFRLKFSVFVCQRIYTICKRNFIQIKLV